MSGTRALAVEPALPAPGAPQPTLTIPPGDLRLGNGLVLRCVVRPFRPDLSASRLKVEG